jgi:hypothetical protein
VDLGSVSLGEIDPWMQRETTEKWIGTIAEARGHAGITGKRHAQGHEGHERLEALGRRDVARDARERRVERRRVRIKLGWNVGAADSAFAMGQNELRWIESGLGDDRRIARGDTFSDAVDGGESLRLVALYPVKRGIQERKARRGIEIVRGRRHTRRRERRVRGQGAQGLARFVDRMRLDGPRLGAWARKRREGARGVVHACAGRRRRAESLDRAQRVGRVWGCGLAPSGHALVARLRSGERGHDRAALFKPSLPGHDFVHLAVEGIPLEQLPAGSFVEPRALRPDGPRKPPSFPLAARGLRPSGRRGRRHRR